MLVAGPVLRLVAGPEVPLDVCPAGSVGFLAGSVVRFEAEPEDLDWYVVSWPGDEAAVWISGFLDSSCLVLSSSVTGWVSDV